MRSHGRILFGVREGEELFDIRLPSPLTSAAMKRNLSSSINFHSSAISGSSRSTSSSPKSYSSALYSAQVTMPSMFSSASSNLSFESSSLNDLKDLRIQA